MRLCQFFALAVGGVSLIAVTPNTADACHFWGRGGGWGYGGPRYVAPAPAYYAPAPVYQAPAVMYHAPGPVYQAPRVVYPAAPQPYYPAPAMRAMPAAPVGPSPTATTSATVTARDDVFEPATLNVRPGTTVRWVNNGQHPHTVTDREGRFDSGDIRPGGSFTHTFQTAGTYRYYCKHHKGMEGTIVVGEPGKGPDAGGSGASKGPSY